MLLVLWLLGFLLVPINVLVCVFSVQQREQRDCGVVHPPLMSFLAQVRLWGEYGVSSLVSRLQRLDLSISLFFLSLALSLPLPLALSLSLSGRDS